MQYQSKEMWVGPEIKYFQPGIEYHHLKQLDCNDPGGGFLGNPIFVALLLSSLMR